MGKILPGVSSSVVTHRSASAKKQRPLDPAHAFDDPD
jgi:hypothetical protein